MSELQDRLLAFWTGLSSREQILLGVAAGSLLLVILVFGVIRPIAGALDDRNETALAAQRVEIMRRLRDEYDLVNSRLAAVEGAIRASRQGGNLRTLLGSLARSANVEVESMEERQAGDSPLYQETRVDVRLSSVTLEQAVKYLHSIESNQRPLSIKSLRIRNRADKSQRLDVSFSVSAFAPV